VLGAADDVLMLDYERLDAYQCALQFAARAFGILQALPRGHSELADQLKRATISVPLNIAEGAGKTSERERARYHAIARGSAMECAAVIDLLKLQQLVEPQQAAEAKALSVRLVAMLSKMCR
jgi:four helix bundle protein